MNANEQNLIQYVIDGDIRKAQEQVKIILDNTNTAKDSVFKETMLRKMSVRQIGQIELPYNMKEIAIAEDVRNFPENRFVLRESEKQVIDKLFAVRKAALQLQELGIHYTCSLLLEGAPGTGKTELARYIAYKADLPFVFLKLSGIIDSALGKTTKNIGTVFDYCHRSSCVLCLDEIDAIGSKRGKNFDVSEMNRITIAVMQELDRLSNNVILIGTTNRADVLDEALVRRFTFKHHVKELSRGDVEVLCRKFLTSVQYPIELCTVETITDSIYAKSKTPTVNDVVSSCTDNIIEWIVAKNKL